VIIIVVIVLGFDDYSAADHGSVGGSLRIGGVLLTSALEIDINSRITGTLVVGISLNLLLLVGKFVLWWCRVRPRERTFFGSN
jgi:hypothetical protein